MGRGQARRLWFAFVCLVPQAGPRCWCAQARHPHGDRRVSSWYLLWEQWDWCLLLERLTRRSPRSPRTALCPRRGWLWVSRAATTRCVAASLCYGTLGSVSSVP